MHSTFRIPLILGALAISAAAQSPLTTTFNSSTFLAASGTTVYFDLNVRSGVSINQIDVNFFGAAGLPVSIDVWVRNGTHVGNNTSQAGWTLAGSSNAGTSNGRDVATPMTFASPITLQPGLWGVAIQHQGTGAAYTAGTSVGNVFASTAEMDFLEGGSANPPIFNGTQNAPRVMNCSIYYQPLGGFASATPYGTGCGGVADYASYYENFPINTFDLGGAPGAERVINHIASGSGYVVFPGGSSWFNPVSPDLALGATAVSGTLPLGFSFPIPNSAAGSTTDIVVCSDGYIWLDSTATLADFTPSVNELLSQAPRLAPLWMDLNPTAGGSIHFDSDPANGVAYVTWLQVPQSGSSATITMQVALFSSGNIEYRYGAETIGLLSSSFALTGMSPGGGVLDPGNTDISASLPFQVAPDNVVPDMVMSSNRPVEGTTLTINVDQIPPNTVLGTVVVSPTQVLPGLQPIPGLGSCLQFVNLDDVTYFVPTGPSQVLSLPIPAGVFTGVTLYGQAVTLTPGINNANVASSNGIAWTIDVN